MQKLFWKPKIQTLLDLFDFLDVVESTQNLLAKEMKNTSYDLLRKFPQKLWLKDRHIHIRLETNPSFGFDMTSLESEWTMFGTLSHENLISNVNSNWVLRCLIRLLMLDKNVHFIDLETTRDFILHILIGEFLTHSSCKKAMLT